MLPMAPDSALATALAGSATWLRLSTGPTWLDVQFGVTWASAPCADNVKAVKAIPATAPHRAARAPTINDVMSSPHKGIKKYRRESLEKTQPRHTTRLDSICDDA